MSRATDVCRTCLRLSYGDFPFYPLETAPCNSENIDLKTQLKTCIPGLNLITGYHGGSICNSCFNALQTVHDFVKMCMETEKKMEGFVIKYGVVNPFGHLLGHAQDTSNHSMQDINDTSTAITNGEECNIVHIKEEFDEPLDWLFGSSQKPFEELDDNLYANHIKQEVEMTEDADQTFIKQELDSESDHEFTEQPDLNFDSTDLQLIEKACETIPLLIKHKITAKNLDCFVSLKRLPDDYSISRSCATNDLDSQNLLVRTSKEEHVGPNMRFQVEMFQCEICGKLSKSLAGYISHMRTHKVSIYSCRVCRKSFRTVKAVERHMQQFHRTFTEHNYSTLGTYKHTKAKQMSKKDLAQKVKEFRETTVPAPILTVSEDFFENAVKSLSYNVDTAQNYEYHTDDDSNEGPPQLEIFDAEFDSRYSTPKTMPKICKMVLSSAEEVKDVTKKSIKAEAPVFIARTRSSPRNILIKNSQKLPAGGVVSTNTRIRRPPVSLLKKNIFVTSIINAQPQIQKQTKPTNTTKCVKVKRNIFNANKIQSLLNTSSSPNDTVSMETKLQQPIADAAFDNVKVIEATDVCQSIIKPLLKIKRNNSKFQIEQQANSLNISSDTDSVETEMQQLVQRSSLAKNLISIAAQDLQQIANPTLDNTAFTDTTVSKERNISIESEIQGQSRSLNISSSSDDTVSTETEMQQVIHRSSSAESLISIGTENLDPITNDTTDNTKLPSSSKDIVSMETEIHKSRSTENLISIGTEDLQLQPIEDDTLEKTVLTDTTKETNLCQPIESPQKTDIQQQTSTSVSMETEIHQLTHRSSSVESLISIGAEDSQQIASPVTLTEATVSNETNADQPIKSTLIKTKRPRRRKRRRIARGIIRANRLSKKRIPKKSENKQAKTPASYNNPAKNTVPEKMVSVTETTNDVSLSNDGLKEKHAFISSLNRNCLLGMKATCSSGRVKKPFHAKVPSNLLKHASRKLNEVERNSVEQIHENGDMQLSSVMGDKNKIDIVTDLQHWLCRLRICPFEDQINIRKKISFIANLNFEGVLQRIETVNTQRNKKKKQRKSVVLRPSQLKSSTENVATNESEPLFYLCHLCISDFTNTEDFTRHLFKEHNICTPDTKKADVILVPSKHCSDITFKDTKRGECASNSLCKGGNVDGNFDNASKGCITFNDLIKKQTKEDSESVVSEEVNDSVSNNDSEMQEASNSMSEVSLENSDTSKSASPKKKREKREIFDSTFLENQKGNKSYGLRKKAVSYIPFSQYTRKEKNKSRKPNFKINPVSISATKEMENTSAKGDTNAQIITSSSSITSHSFMESSTTPLDTSFSSNSSILICYSSSASVTSEAKESPVTVSVNSLPTVTGSSLPVPIISTNSSSSGIVLSDTIEIKQTSALLEEETANEVKLISEQSTSSESKCANSNLNIVKQESASEKLDSISVTTKPIVECQNVSTNSDSDVCDASAVLTSSSSSIAAPPIPLKKRTSRRLALKKMASGNKKLVPEKLASTSAMKKNPQSVAKPQDILCTGSGLDNSTFSSSLSNESNVTLTPPLINKPSKTVYTRKRTSTKVASQNEKENELNSKQLVSPLNVVTASSSDHFQSVASSSAPQKLMSKKASTLKHSKEVSTTLASSVLGNSLSAASTVGLPPQDLLQKELIACDKESVSSITKNVSAKELNPQPLQQKELPAPKADGGLKHITVLQNVLLNPVAVPTTSKTIIASPHLNTAPETSKDMNAVTASLTFSDSFSNSAVSSISAKNADVPSIPLATAINNLLAVKRIVLSPINTVTVAGEDFYQIISSDDQSSILASNGAYMNQIGTKVLYPILPLSTNLSKQICQSKQTNPAKVTQQSKRKQRITSNSNYSVSEKSKIETFDAVVERQQALKGNMPKTDSNVQNSSQDTSDECPSIILNEGFILPIQHQENKETDITPDNGTEATTTTLLDKNETVSNCNVISIDSSDTHDERTSDSSTDAPTDEGSPKIILKLNKKLIQSLKRKTRRKPKRLKFKKGAKTKYGGKLKCHYCSKLFRTFTCWENHMLNEHIKENPSVIDSKENDELNELDTIKKSIDELVTKIKEIRKYECDECDMAFVSKAQIKMHRKLTHHK